MIIWSGYGFIVFLIVFLCSLISNLVTNFLAKDDNYYHENSIPLGISFILSAIVIQLLWKYFNKKKLENKGTRVFDRITIAGGDQNRLFFIPFRFWTYIMAGLGLILIVAQLVS